MLNISGIEDILPRHQEISNGSKKEYTVAFDLIDTKFVSVYLGSEKQTTGYSVDIENKKVTFNSAPTTGLLVTIVRVVPASWESELHGALNSDSLNVLFTKIIASLQTIKEEVNRSLKSNVFDENNSEQKFEFFLKQLADAQDVLNRAENNLSLLETTGQDSLNSINTARDNALEDIEEIRSETISEVIELTDSFLDYDNITNCITEIPQDIKLELNDGVLTLKAGSKAYIPNGANVFNEVVIESDKTYTRSGAGVFLITCRSTNQLDLVELKYSYSGTTQPSLSSKYAYWYDTTNNILKKTGDTGSTWLGGYSLPLAIITTSEGKITSIDQVFNGFGYIGSTAFALPGVKRLYADGRNEDGSLKNIEITTSKVLTRTITYGGKDYTALINANNGLTESDLTNFYIQNDVPSIKQGIYERWFNINENYWYLHTNTETVWHKAISGSDKFVIYGKQARDATGVITKFELCAPFRAVDYNDFNKLDGEVAKLGVDNTFTGLNTFTGILKTSNNYPMVEISNTEIERGTLPTEIKYCGLLFEDKNGDGQSPTRLGDIVYSISAQGDAKTAFKVWNFSGNVNENAAISIVYPSSGNPYATAPTPPSGDNSTKIVTTEWCYDPTKSTNLVHRTGDETVLGIMDFKDNIYAPNQLDYNNITNCITEIPQDIKLELNNGTLTLKAGSKVYVPNGANVFKELVIENNISTQFSNNGTLICLVREDGNKLIVSTPNKTVSGATDSASTQTYHTWFDTTNNVIKRFTEDLVNPVYNCSFPICIVTVSDGKIASIDQVFNGFGYIGSTVFALPGVKGLIPNGRNEDGSLNNKEFTFNKIFTTTVKSNRDFIISCGEYWITERQSVEYNEKENLNYFNGLNEPYYEAIACYTSGNGSGVACLTPKLPFRAVDYNDFNKLENDFNKLENDFNKLENDFNKLENDFNKLESALPTITYWD